MALTGGAVNAKGFNDKGRYLFERGAKDKRCPNAPEPVVHPLGEEKGQWVKDAEIGKGENI